MMVRRQIISAIHTAQTTAIQLTLFILRWLAAIFESVIGVLQASIVALNGYGTPEASVGTKQDTSREIRWIEGLRGIAAIIVVTYHTMMAWAPWLMAASTENGTHFWQQPIIRVIHSGRIAIPIFAFVTGYTTALKPLRYIWRADQEGSLQVVQKSVQRRFPRMMLPPFIALLITWIFAQLGFYRVASETGSGFQQYASAPVLSGGLVINLCELIKMAHWDWVTNHRMVYDDYHWALLPLLICSLQVFLCLLFVMRLRLGYRISTYLVMMSYWYWNPRGHSETFGMQAFVGMLVCDLSQHPGVTKLIDRSFLLNMVIPIIIFPTGLYIVSAPYGESEQSDWAQGLRVLAYSISPSNTDWKDRCSAYGFDLCVIAVFLNPRLKKALSGGFIVWLGSISYAIYLVHGTILRTVLVWLVVRKARDSEPGEQPKFLTPAPISFLWALPMFVITVLICATLWKRYIEDECARFSSRVEKHMDCGHEQSDVLLGALRTPE